MCHQNVSELCSTHLWKYLWEKKDKGELAPFAQGLLLIQFSSTFDHDSYMHAFILHMYIEKL